MQTSMTSTENSRADHGSDHSQQALLLPTSRSHQFVQQPLRLLKISGVEAFKIGHGLQPFARLSFGSICDNLGGPNQMRNLLATHN
jgi:hypothetical protein